MLFSTSRFGFKGSEDLGDGLKAVYQLEGGIFLDQGISDVLPARLGFYENWLHAEGLRAGTIGLGPVTAVLSFLRQEGDAYDIITERAGEYGGPPADATVRIGSDGKVECLCGTQDIGTGTRTAMAIVTAEVLGLKPEQVHVVLGDTATGMYSPASGGSVTLTSILPAVRSAAEGARRKLLETAAPALGVKPENLDLKDGRIATADGRKSLGFAQASAPLKSAVISAQASRVENYKGTGGESWGAQFAEVEVDTATGQVRVLKIAAAHDAGRTINRLTSESQINGGVIMALSYALLEQRVMDAPTGIVMNPNLEDYKIAGPMEMPEIVPIMVEASDAANNIGVKGLGEPPVVPTAAAIANAVSNAIGVRVRDLPITPDRVLALLGKVKEA